MTTNNYLKLLVEDIRSTTAATIGAAAHTAAGHYVGSGCIGCKICEKKCISGAITVTDFHASIDYAKCTGCGVCYEACPVGAITNCEK